MERQTCIMGWGLALNLSKIIVVGKVSISHENQTISNIKWIVICLKTGIVFGIA